jgi:purine-binding chemotaxis protein CheW
MPSASPTATAHDVLQARAKALARVPTEAGVPGESLEVVEFALAHERYALESSYVREVHPLEDLTPLPGTPAFVRGLVNIRGQILAVLDLKRFFDLPEIGITDLHSILLIQSGDLEFGLLADLIIGTRVLARAALQPSLPTLTGIRADYLLGVTPQRLVVLNAARIVADPRLIVNDEPES